MRRQRDRRYNVLTSLRLDDLDRLTLQNRLNEIGKGRLPTTGRQRSDA